MNVNVQVYAVQFSNYEPAEIDSIWWSYSQAKSRAEELGDMWKVVPMVVQGMIIQDDSIIVSREEDVK